MKIPRVEVPLVWIIDEDLKKSAEYLTNDLLLSSLQHCYQCLICAHYYFGGIHNAKAFKYYFNAEHFEETVDRLFVGLNLPLDILTKPKKKSKLFSFAYYKHRVVKWLRLSYTHYYVFQKYLMCLYNEAIFRKLKRLKIDEDIYEFLILPIELNPLISKYLKPNSRIDYQSNPLILQQEFPEFQLEWKASLPIKYREKNVLNGYKNYYLKYITPANSHNVFIAYSKTPRDIPPFVLEYHTKTSQL